MLDIWGWMTAISIMPGPLVRPGIGRQGFIVRQAGRLGIYLAIMVAGETVSNLSVFHKTCMRAARTSHMAPWMCVKAFFFPSTFQLVPR